MTDTENNENGRRAAAILDLLMEGRRIVPINEAAPSMMTELTLAVASIAYGTTPNPEEAKEMIRGKFAELVCQTIDKIHDGMKASAN